MIEFIIDCGVQGSMFSLSDPSLIHCELNIPSQLTTPTGTNCNGETSNEVIILFIILFICLFICLLLLVE